MFICTMWGEWQKYAQIMLVSPLLCWRLIIGATAFSFEPPLMCDISNMFNQSSTARYLISYKRPKKIMTEFGFQVECIGKLQTSMHGSSEGHTCYFFRRLDSESIMDTQQFCTASDVDAVPCDQLFQNAWDVCKGGCFDSIYNHVDWKVDVFLQEKEQRKRKAPERLGFKKKYF